jgi:hypothetical protein
MSTPLTLNSVSRNLDPNEAKGPLAILAKNAFASTDHRYPINLGTNNFEGLHYVTFYVNVQEKSNYNIQERTNIGPTANQNRANDAAAGVGQIASGNQIISDSTVGQLFAEGVGGFAFGAALGGGAGALAAELGGPLVGIAAAGVGGAVGGLIGSTIVSSIDLSRKTKRLKSTISMYMPDTINQQIIHEYGEISMTEALGMVGAIGQGAAGVGSTIEGFIKEGKGDLKGAGAGSMSELVGTLAEKSGVFGGGIKEALLFSAGLAQNPQVEILYQKTGHREFMFDFKMSARSEAEAAAIRKIIKEFKFHSAPELLRGSSGRFFIPPAEFDIKFFYNGKENTNIHKISSCVLVGIDVNYAAAGQWTTFSDGMPVDISMQLRFKELELMHKGRIEEGY